MPVTAGADHRADDHATREPVAVAAAFRWPDHPLAASAEYEVANVGSHAFQGRRETYRRT